MYLDSLQSVDDQKIKDGYSYLKAMKYNLKVLKRHYKIRRYYVIYKGRRFIIGI